MANKLYGAISGKAVAEIIVFRVDDDKPNMGLTTWKVHPNEEAVLQHSGVSHEMAKALVEQEYDKFYVEQS